MADTDDHKSAQPKRKQRKERGRTGYGRPRLHPDIFALDGADYAGVDLVTGGFPCQPFSVAGKRRGASDDRAIWPEMLRVIAESRPRWVLGENVAGIVTMELDNILSDLEGIGYSAWAIIVPACAVDARHRRDRVWIIARRDVADSAGERSGGASGNALHQEWRASQTRGAGVSKTTGRENGAAISVNRPTGEDVAHAAQGGLRRGSASGEAGQPALGSKAVAHADGARKPQQVGSIGEQRERTVNGGEGPAWIPCPEGCGEFWCNIHDMHACDCDCPPIDEWKVDPYTERPRLQGKREGRTAARTTDGPGDGSDSCLWPVEPAVGRVAHGIPHRSHRLKGLGNAIVPQVAEVFLRAIHEQLRP